MQLLWMIIHFTQHQLCYIKTKRNVTVSQDKLGYMTRPTNTHRYCTVLFFAKQIQLRRNAHQLRQCEHYKQLPNSAFLGPQSFEARFSVVQVQLNSDH
jgi:hypothetical protein